MEWKKVVVGPHLLPLDVQWKLSTEGAFACQAPSLTELSACSTPQAPLWLKGFISLLLACDCGVKPKLLHRKWSMNKMGSSWQPHSSTKPLLLSLWLPWLYSTHWLSWPCSVLAVLSSAVRDCPRYLGNAHFLSSNMFKIMQLNYYGSCKQLFELYSSAF